MFIASAADPYVDRQMPGGSRSDTYGDINPTIVLGDVGGRSDAQIKALVMQGMVEALEAIGDR